MTKTKWEQLTETLPAVTREQMAEILLSRLAHGWGTIEIRVKDHAIREYIDGQGIPAVRPREEAGEKP